MSRRRRYGSTVTVEVDVDIGDVLDDLDDEELVEEMKQRGYTCVKDAGYHELMFDRQDWDFLLELIDKNPGNWYTRRVRDKLFEARNRV